MFANPVNRQIKVICTECKRSFIHQGNRDPAFKIADLEGNIKTVALCQACASELVPVFTRINKGDD